MSCLSGEEDWRDTFPMRSGSLWLPEKIWLLVAKPGPRESARACEAPKVSSHRGHIPLGIDPEIATLDGPTCSAQLRSMLCPEKARSARAPEYVPAIIRFYPSALRLGGLNPPDCHYPVLGVIDKSDPR